mgnify:CR=1 FL=1
MATQTSLVAQQVRIRQWEEQIRNCQDHIGVRPHEIQIKEINTGGQTL